MYTRIPASAAIPPPSQNNSVMPTLCVYCMTLVGVKKIPVPGAGVEVLALR